MSQILSPKSPKKKKRGLFGLGGNKSSDSGRQSPAPVKNDGDDSDDEGLRSFVPGSQYTTKKPSSASNLSGDDDEDRSFAKA